MDLISFLGMRRAHREFLAQVPLRESRILDERQNPFVSLSDAEFRKQYRFTKEGIIKLTDLIEPDLVFADGRGSPLSPMQQVCLAMTYFASDTPQRSAGYIAGVKSTCANATVKRFVEAICHLAPEVIKMPSEEQMEETAEFFQDRYGLPNFAYGVDGTHIRLRNAPSVNELPPGTNPQDFWCRKQFYSINVQIIGNQKRLLYNIVARYPGSAHDSRVWSFSQARRWTEQHHDFLLAGDSAYPISQTLMKPYTRPTDPKHRRFNAKLSGIRTICTENLIGIWKRRFPVLVTGLRTKLNFTLDIIVALGVLHNYAILWSEPDADGLEGLPPPEDDDQDGNREDRTRQGAAATRAAGQAHRDWLADQFC